MAPRKPLEHTSRRGAPRRSQSPSANRRQARSSQPSASRHRSRSPHRTGECSSYLRRPRSPGNSRTSHESIHPSSSRRRRTPQFTPSPDSPSRLAVQPRPSVAELLARPVNLPDAPTPQGLNTVFVNRHPDQTLWSSVGLNKLFSGAARPLDTKSERGRRNWFGAYTAHHAFYPKMPNFSGVLSILAPRHWGILQSSNGFRCADFNEIAKIDDFLVQCIRVLARHGGLSDYIETVLLLAELEIDPENTRDIWAQSKDHGIAQCDRMGALARDHLALLSMLLAWTSCGLDNKDVGMTMIIEYAEKGSALSATEAHLVYNLSSSWVCDWDEPRWGAWVHHESSGLALLSAYVEAKVPAWVCWDRTPSLVPVKGRTGGLPLFMRPNAAQARMAFPHNQDYIRSLGESRPPARVAAPEWTNYVPAAPMLEQAPPATASITSRKMPVWNYVRPARDGEDVVDYFEELLFNGQLNFSEPTKPLGGWLSQWICPGNKWKFREWREGVQEGEWDIHATSGKYCATLWEDRIDTPWYMRYIQKLHLIVYSEFLWHGPEPKCAEDYMTNHSPHLCNHDLDVMRYNLRGVPIPASGTSPSQEQDVRMEIDTGVPFVTAELSASDGAEYPQDTYFDDDTSRPSMRPQDHASQLPPPTTNPARQLVIPPPHQAAFLSDVQTLELLGIKLPFHLHHITSAGLELSEQSFPAFVPTKGMGIANLAQAWRCLGQVLPDGIKEATLAVQVHRMGIEPEFAVSILTFVTQLAIYGKALHGVCSKLQYRHLHVMNDFVSTTTLSSADNQNSEPQSDIWIYHVDAWPSTYQTILARNAIKVWRVNKIMTSIPTSEGVYQREVFSITHLVKGGFPIVLYEALAVVAALLHQPCTTYTAVLRFCVEHGIRFAAPEVVKGADASHKLEEAVQAYRIQVQSWRRSRRLGLQRQDFYLTPDMYSEWKHVVTRMLQESRILRACLRHGGILWRLAVEYGDVETVLSGQPSDEAIKFGIGEEFTMQGASTQYACFDDVLELEEQRKLLGVFIVPQSTRQDVGTAENRSLWPLPHTWTDSGLDTVLWSPAAEAFFVNLDKEYSQLATEADLTASANRGKSRKNSNSGIERGLIGRVSVSQPRTGALWRKWIRDGQAPSSRVWYAARHQSRKFVEACLIVK